MGIGLSKGLCEALPPLSRLSRIVQRPAGRPRITEARGQVKTETRLDKRTKR
jgi:hypothetical protein